MRKIVCLLVFAVLLTNGAFAGPFQNAPQKIGPAEAESLIIEAEFIYSTGKTDVAVGIAKSLGDRIYESNDPSVKKAFLPRTLFLIGAYYYETKGDTVVAQNYYDDVLRLNPEFAGDPKIYKAGVLDHFTAYVEEKKAMESARLKEIELREKDARVKEEKDKELRDLEAKAKEAAVKEIRETKPTVVQPSAPPPTVNPSAKARVIKRDAVLRVEPDEKSEAITKVPLGAEFAILEVKGDWVKVELPEQNQGFKISGYLHKSDVKLI